MQVRAILLMCFTLILSILSMAKGNVSTKAATSDEASRMPASFGSPVDLGNMYLAISDGLADVRAKKSQICEFGAYQGEILTSLTKAKNYFGESKTTPKIDIEMKSSLGYRLFSKYEEYIKQKDGNPKFFSGLVFFGRSMGTFGSMEQIILGDLGKGKIKVLKVSDNGETNWVSYPLSWNFVRNDKGASLVFTHSASGSPKTRSYRIIEYGTASEFQGGLVPGNKAKKMDVNSAGYNEIQYFSMIIDECDA